VTPDRIRPVVFTAQSKVYFYCRDAVCEFAIKEGAVPLNPFRVFEYFLGDRVERMDIRSGNNELIRISDELWVFGATIADGVFAEIVLASQLAKPIRFFNIHNDAKRIRPIKAESLRFERELYTKSGLGHDDLLRSVLRYIDHAPADQLDLFQDLV
jgi:hypothetical protein